MLSCPSRQCNHAMSAMMWWLSHIHIGSTLKSTSKTEAHCQPCMLPLLDTCRDNNSHLDFLSWAAPPKCVSPSVSLLTLCVATLRQQHSSHSTNIWKCEDPRLALGSTRIPALVAQVLIHVGKVWCIAVSSSTHLCQNLQCIFAHECLVSPNCQGPSLLPAPTR